MKKIARVIYELLLAPSATVNRPEIQRRVTLLACLNLIYLFSALFFSSVSWIEHFAFTYAPFQTLLLVSLILHLVSYTLIRTRFYEIGGMIFCATMFMVVSLTIFIQPQLSVLIGSLPFFVVPAMFATFALPFRRNVIISLGCAVGAIFSASSLGYIDHASVVPMLVFNLTALSILVTGSYLKKLDARQLAQEQLHAFHVARMSTLGELVGGVAHEINNPITVIQLRATHALRLLEQTPIDMGRINEFLASIQKTATHIEEVVKGLLSLSRTGYADPFEDVAVSAIIDESMSLFGEQLRNEHIEIRLLPFDKSIKVQCRATQITQILLNLYSNSKAALRTLDEKWIEVSVNELADEVVISVVDSGKGIAPSVSRMIFEPFFTAKKVEEGTGIGLSISRTIARAHHGDLRYDPKHPHTRFELRIRKRHI